MLKNKKKKKLFVYIIIYTMLISTICVGFNVIGILNGGLGNKDISSKDYLSNEYYKLGGSATDYQKEVFKELTEELEKPATEERDLNAALLVGKSFVSDLFTFSNKDGNYDIGGLQYLYGSSLSGFKDYMKDSLYKDLDLYIAQYGRSYLPTVKEVNGKSVYNGKFKTAFGEFDSYYMELKWEYEDFEKSSDSTDEVVNTDDFQHEIYLYVIKTDEGRFEVVQFFDSF